MNAAIIGAGIAGVSAAEELQRAGVQVTLFEKSRGVGGRCSSRRWNGHIVDHGTQFLGGSDSAFLKKVRAASGENLKEVGPPVLDNSGTVCTSENGRFYHLMGNSHLVKDLAVGMNVCTEHPVQDALPLLKTSGGDFDCVLSTAPGPQTAKLFSIEWKCRFSASATAVFDFAGDFVGCSSGQYAFEDEHGDLAWTACENHKLQRVAPGHTVIVAQMSNAFTQNILHLPKEDYPKIVLPYVLDRWSIPSDLLLDSFGHRWLLASALDAALPPALPPGCFVAGDAVSGPGLENAWFSGKLAAQQILQQTVLET